MILAAAVLSIVLSSPVCSAPCSVHVLVKIEHASARDQCEVVIDGENWYRATVITVEEGRRTYERWLTIPIAGEYDVVAVLDRPVKHHYEEHRVLMVTGGNK